jgi:dihydrofolate reductase
MIPYVSKLYITWVDKDFEADTFFKGYNAADWLVETEESNYSEENDFTYRYTVYKRPLQNS